jgi:hypothetical protein
MQHGRQCKRRLLVPEKVTSDFSSIGVTTGRPSPRRTMQELFVWWELELSHTCNCPSHLTLP